jgi:phosphatidylglycerol:prolipoprotein diacylglycerol transferase
VRSRIIQELGLENWSFLVPDYWFMLSAAIILGACLTVRQARRLGMERDVAINAVFYSVLLLFPCARLVFAFQYWREFSAPWQLLDPTRGGLALLGGFFGVVLGGALYLRKHRTQIDVFLDATVPALAFGLFLGRLGCFLAGCNWGRTTELPWGVCFPAGGYAFRQQTHAGAIGPDALLSLPVHPTQLYESLFGLLMLPLALWLLRREYWGERSRPIPGRPFLIAMSAYAVFRILVELIRADSGGLHLGPVTVAQGVSLLILLLCLGFLWKRGMIARGGIPHSAEP